MTIEDEQNNKNNLNNTQQNQNNQIKKEKDSNQKNVVTYHYYFADEDQCNTFVRVVVLVLMGKYVF